MSELRTARERAGISQEQLAARLRREGLAVERTAISYWERHDAVPDDLRPVLARVLRAPELLPGSGVLFDDTPLEALAWLREEVAEAAGVIDRICEMLRRGEDPRHLEAQLFDLITGLRTYFGARMRHDGVDFAWYEHQHREKLRERHGARRRVAA